MSDVEQKRTLVLEVEVPGVQVDDIPELIREFGHESGAPEWEQILTELGDATDGLLYVRVGFPKGGDEILRRPVRFIGARIEDRPPEDLDLEHLEVEVDERYTEAAWSTKDGELVRWQDG